MNRTSRYVAGASLALLSLASFAQATTPPATPRIDAREVRQERRIDQGAASGQLTAHEQKRLGREQTAIARAETKAKADGTVTGAERHRLTHLQNRASRDIRRQKHDAQTAQR